MTNSERERLLAIPAAALTKPLGKRGTPAFFYVQRKGHGGKLRTERRTLVTAVDRLRRCTEEHPAGGGLTLDEALEEIQRLLAQELAPWPGLQTTSVEMDDAGRQAVWTRLLAPWPRFELNAVSLDKSGTVKTRGKLDVPGGGTIWTIDALTSPAGMAAVCGIARSGLNIYWRPASGCPVSCLLVDDWTKPPEGTPGVRPEDAQTDEGRCQALELLRWAQPSAFLQTSRWKSQAIFVVAGGLLEHGRELAARMNRAYGDANVRDLNHWARLPGVWNFKKKEPWCCRVLDFSRCRSMADAWLAQELRRLRAVQGDLEETSSMSSAPSSRVRPGCPAEWQPPAGALPAPEDVDVGNRNTEATRAVGTYLAQHWGDETGADAFLRRWNARLPQSLDEVERARILASIVQKDRENHPERWVGKSVPSSPVPRLTKSETKLAPTAPHASSASAKMQARDMTMEEHLARLAAEKAGAVVRADLQTPEACLAAVREDGRALQFLPEGLRTLDVCLAACQQNGTAMEFVPDRLKTPEFCLEAVRRDSRALQHVPDGLKTPEMCMDAVRGGGWALKVVPDGLKTPELCLVAVRKNGWALWWVPDALKTPELCLEAVRQDGM
ncbi:MAG: DUF4116 domain-containing protein, partial [Desulfovibrio sp.]|nr:DUF4116 domain-containing protein [Desulfovibrio sp.]